MKFYLGADHAGYKTKEALQKFLQKKGIETIDLGTHNEKRVDYPEFAEKVAKKVIEENSYGLLVCGTGIGMCMAANKIKGIRAANPFDAYTAEKAREHNHANIICLGGRTYTPAKAKKILSAFINAKKDEGERHTARIKKISSLEN